MAMQVKKNIKVKKKLVYKSNDNIVNSEKGIDMDMNKS